MSEPLRLDTGHGSLSAAIHTPVRPSGDRVILTHGASGSYATPNLVAVCDALAERGIEAVRFNLPAAERKRRSPDRAPIVEAVWRDVAARLRDGTERLVIGGRSYGGRMASHVAAVDPHACDGVLLLAYPLHPPGKPEQQRTQHLSSIQVPILVVQGDRDPFASGTLLEEAFEPLERATIHRIPGGDHSHAVRGRTTADVAAEVAGAVVAWLAASVDSGAA